MAGFCWLVLGLRLGFTLGGNLGVLAGIGMTGMSLRGMLRWVKRDRDVLLLGFACVGVSGVWYGVGYQITRMGMEDLLMGL